jgi:transposase
MMALVPQMRVLVAVEPVDFRKGIDGLVAVCRQRLQAEPMSGAVFIFGSRRRRSLKLLAYDGQGFVLCQKRLSQGRFRWWPTATGSSTVRLDAPQVQMLLWNGDPTRTTAAPLWRRLQE